MSLTRRRQLGPFEVAAIGLGCMNLSHVYLPIPDRATGERVLLSALDAGVDHFDTAALYGFGANEELLGEVLAPHRDRFTLASKCGMTGIDGKRVIDGRPETIKATARAALTRLNTDVIDLYYLHRVDKNVPIAESVGALSDLVQEGLIRSIGLSEVSGETLRAAHAVHPIAAVQNEYSLWSRNPELGSLQACRELGITMVAFSPVARGFLTDVPPVMADLPAGDLRHHMPRFAGTAYAANLAIHAQLVDLSREAGCTVAQLALAWVLAQDECVVAIPGTRSVEHLAEDLVANDLELSPEVLRRAGDLLNADTVHGPRYGAAAAGDVDTESFPTAG